MSLAVGVATLRRPLPRTLRPGSGHRDTRLRVSSGQPSQLIGSIAERILRGGSVPILLRTVRRPDGASFELRTLPVPIDFGHDVETALTAARTLAAPYRAKLVLLAAPEPPPPPTPRLLPETTALTRQCELHDLGHRLAELAQQLSTDLDLQTIVADASPADAILDAAESLPADLIVLVTHAHAGLSSWYDPSIGQRLLRHPDGHRLIGARFASRDACRDTHAGARHAVGTRPACRQQQGPALASSA